MENQLLPQDDLRCAAPGEKERESRSSALIPRAQPRLDPPVCEELGARTGAAARQAGIAMPLVLPGAAVTLINVELPLKSDRLRRKALSFAVEDQLVEATEPLAHNWATTAIWLPPATGPN